MNARRLDAHPIASSRFAASAPLAGRSVACRVVGALSLAALVSLGSGCSLEPIYRRPAPPVSSAFPAWPAERAPVAAAGTAIATPAAADLGWRDFMPDPRLQQLVELALQNNRDLRVAVLRVAQVQAQYRLQRAALLPSVSAEARSSYGRVQSTVSPSANGPVGQVDSAGLAAAWELDLFGRLRSLTDAALQQYLASAEARRAAELLLVSQVADQYLTVVAAGEQLAVTRNTLKTAQASYDILKLQFDSGTAAELDLRLAETVVEQAQANEAAQIRSQAQLVNGLVLLVGQPLPVDVRPTVALADQAILADVPAGLPSDLLDRRPDILEAEAQLRSENADIGAARAAFFPQISLTAAFGRASSTLGGLFGAGATPWSFVPSLVQPIFDGGANRANLDIATVQRDIGVAQYEGAIQTAFREVADGLAARGTYDDQLAAQQRNTAAEQRRLEIADNRYRNGVDNYLNVLTAQTDLYNAQQALITTRLNRLTALVDLYRALGGGWLARTGDAPRGPLAGGSSDADAPMARAR